jgi:hypothetical protein
MTKYQPLWQQAGSYAASVDRGLLGTLWPAGGVSGAAVAAVANTMQVQAQPGTVGVVMQAGQGVELCRWDAAADSTVTLSAAPPSGQSRIDVYCVQVRDNAVDAGGNNDFIFTVVTGTPAASNPATPATPANAYALANVTVPGAAANLNAATLTDRRGGVLAPVPGVQGTIYYSAASMNISTPSQILPMAALSLRGGMTAPANNLVVPVSGVYRVSWQAYGAPSGPNGWVQSMVYRNGVSWTLASLMSTASGQYLGPGGTVELPLNAADVLTLVATSPGTYTQFLGGAVPPLQTYLSASLVAI